VRRRARLQRVEDAVQRNTVISFFHTLYWSRQFRRIMTARNSANLTRPPQFPIPEIFVDEDLDDKTDQGNEGRTRESISPMLSPQSRTGEPSTSRSRSRPSLQIDTSSPARSQDIPSPPREWAAISPSLAPGSLRDSDTEYHGATGDGQGPVGHTRDNSAVSVQNVMQSLGDSAWGESIRRSFTQRRSR
jgi:hypothetical protein